MAMSAEVFGAAQIVRPSKTYDIRSSSGDRLFLLTPSTQITAESCGQEYCKVKHVVDGKTYRFNLKRLELRKVNSRNVRYSPNNRGALNYSSGSGNSELASGSTGSTYFENNSASSSYASCFKNRGHNRYSGKRSQSLCYRGVKRILQDCGATTGYMTTAKRHGGRLTDYAIWAHDDGGLAKQGFRQLQIQDPARAPLGSVIVYRNACESSHPAGHIEIKTGSNEYISDFISSRPMSVKTGCRKVAGIYYK